VVNSAEASLFLGSAAPLAAVVGCAKLVAYIKRLLAHWLWLGLVLGFGFVGVAGLWHQHTGRWWGWWSFYT